MSELYIIYDENISLEASGDFIGAKKLLRSVNRKMNRRTRK